MKKIFLALLALPTILCANGPSKEFYGKYSIETRVCFLESGIDKNDPIVKLNWSVRYGENEVRSGFVLIPVWYYHDSLLSEVIPDRYESSPILPLDWSSNG